MILFKFSLSGAVYVSLTLVAQQSHCSKLGYSKKNTYVYIAQKAYIKA